MNIRYEGGLRNAGRYVLTTVGPGLLFLLLILGCGGPKYTESLRRVYIGGSFIHDGYGGKNFVVTYRGKTGTSLVFDVDPVTSDKYDVTLREGECFEHSDGKTYRRVEKIESDSVTLRSPVSKKDCKTVHVLQHKFN